MTPNEQERDDELDQQEDTSRDSGQCFFPTRTQTTGRERDREREGGDDIVMMMKTMMMMGKRF